MEKVLSKEQTKQIFDIIKKEFTLDRAEINGFCCTSCTSVSYFDDNNRVIWNKWYDIEEDPFGTNVSKWDGTSLCIAYNIDHNEVNSIGERMVELAKELFDMEYLIEEKLESDNRCLIINLKAIK